MSKKHKRRVKSDSPQTSVITLWQIVVLVGVVALIGGVLWLKNRPAASEVAAETPLPLSPPTPAPPAATLLLATTMPPATPASSAVLTETAGLAPRAGESPEAHLDRLLAAGQPIFAFFHSNTCYQCTEMAKIVAQVHPDFAEEVALVDVNVYDDANQALLQRAGIRVIPTLIFIDRTGQGDGTTGVMPAEQLQARLAALAAGETP